MQLRIALVVTWAAAGLALFQPQDSSTIEGIVLEAGTDRGLANVRVSLLPPQAAPGPMRDETIAHAVTDAQGRFSILAHVAGRHLLVPALQGFVHARSSSKQTAQQGVFVQISGGMNLNVVRIAMVREAGISGRVLSFNGQAASGQFVSLFRSTYNENGIRFLEVLPAHSHVQINDRGAFRFFALQPGDYYVALEGLPVGLEPSDVQLRTYYPGTSNAARATPIRVSAGEEVHLNTMVVQPSKAVRVRLRFPDPDEELPRLRSVIFGLGEVAGSLTSIMGGRGRIVFPAMAVGNYNLQIPFRTAVARVNLSVGDSDIDQEIRITSAVRITGTLLIHDKAGAPVTIPGAGCQFWTDDILYTQLCVMKPDGSFSANVIPGFVRIAFQGIPADAYLVSATAPGKDTFADGLVVTGDTELHVLFAADGSVIEGVARDSTGRPNPGSVVVLVPDASPRHASPLYRSAIAEADGRFQIRGIAPGDYQLYAWQELDGAAYRNAEFMKAFEGRGKPILVEKTTRISIDVNPIEGP